MKTKIIIITATTLLSASSALAQTPIVTFASGGAGERYNTLCNAIKVEMDRSAEIDCQETGGSYANADLLASGKADAALIQANVRQVYRRTPASRCRSSFSAKPTRRWRSSSVPKTSTSGTSTTWLTTPRPWLRSAGTTAAIR